MKLKTIEIEGKTYALVQDGKPVYEQDGKDVPFDAEHATQKIGQLNGEAKSHREAKEAAEAKLTQFEGIEDPAAARKALETVANLDGKDLIEAGKVEEIKAAAIQATEEKFTNVLAAKDQEIATVTGQRDGLKGDLDRELIGGSFNRSKFVSEKVALPADILQAKFGQHFVVEDGKVKAFYDKNSPVYSREKPGDLASFEEAIEILVDQYPNRDKILKGSGAGGSGAEGGSGGGGDGKTITRAQFDALGPQDRANKMRDGFTVTE